MEPALWAAKTGLDAQQTQMTVTANNLANVATTGFKGSRAEFGDLIASTQRGVSATAIGNGVMVNNVSQQFSSILVSLGPQSISVAGIGESQYGADAGASASLSVSSTARLYLNYDGKFRSNLTSHQGTLGFEIRTVGANTHAARYAGIKVGRTIVVLMAISGGLAGLAGAADVAGLNYYYASAFTAGSGLRMWSRL